MAGAAAAYWLSRMGSVALLEMEDQAGYHTTGRSAAIYLPSYGAPAVRALTKASYDFLDTPPLDLGLKHHLLEPRDVLYIASEERLADLAAFVAEMQSQGVAVASVTKKMALARVPILRAEYFHSAALERGVFDLDVAGLHRGMLRAARSRGGVTHLGAKLESAAHGADGWRVRAGDLQLQARCLVNAAGAWATPVAKLAGAAPLRLDSLRRTMVTVDTGEQPFSPKWPMVETIDESLYFKPESGKLLASCGDETPWPPSDVQPDDMDVAITVDLLEQATSLSVQRVAAQWAGLRTFAADRLPVIGVDPVVPDFYWMAGLGGYGIQTAPALGLLLASQMTELDLPKSLSDHGIHAADFSPARLV